MSEKVSIIITCYNYAQYLPEAIDSALSQTYPSVEVILVNDGSTDDTDKVAKSYGKQIQYLRQDNHGVVAARNNGAALAKGKYVCFLDADDKLHPNFVQALVRGFDADGGIQLAYCDYELIGESGKQWKSGPWNVYRLIFDNYLIPCTLMKRSAYLAVGRYSEYMSGRFGFEDWELWIKFAKHGLQGKYVPGGYFLYRLHGSGRNLEGEKHRRQQIALIRNHNKELYGRFDMRAALLAQRIFWRTIYLFKQATNNI